MYRTILASASPRRSEILRQVGMEFEVCPSTVDEVVTSTVPSEVVMELSAQKAEDIFDRFCNENVLIIAADTVVAKDGKILGKPKDIEEARNMINLIQGCEHKVFTGVTYIYSVSGNYKKESFYEETRVKVFDMSDTDIDNYINTDEPFDKAGGYGIQGLFASYIERIEGDYYNVVGLPIGRLSDKLRKLSH